MRRWQKWLRLCVAVAGVSFAVVLYFKLQSPKPATVKRPDDGRLAPTASVEATKGSLQNVGASRDNYNINFDHIVAYADGRQKFTNPRVVAPRRNGGSFSLTGKEAEASANQEQLVMRGTIELKTSDGLVAHTEEASLNQKEGILRSPQQFSFRRKTLSGSSIGMSYDQNRDLLVLDSAAALKMSPQKAKDAATLIDSGAASMARREHYARFDQGFRLTTGSRVLESDAATAYLTDDDAKVTSLEMRGNSRMTGLGEGVGAVRGMQADDINVEFGADGRTMVGATLAKNASVDMTGTSSGGRRLTADWIDIRLAPDGSTVSGLTARDKVSLTLPASGTEPARTVTARTLSARGEGGKGLTAAKFVGDVVYREIRLTPSGRNTRQVAGKLLDLTTQPGFGEVEDATFAGAVRFNEDKLSASSGNARYLVKTGVIELSGLDDTTGRYPRVSDAQVTVDAPTISVSVDSRQIAASGGVSTGMGAVTGAASAGVEPVHRAAMLKQDQPVFAQAGQLAYDGLKHTAVYTGDARLWQGDTAISGDKISLDDASGNLGATGHVRSSMMLDERDAKTNKVGRVSTIAVAETMAYDDAKRRATYATGAHTTGPQGDLRADKIEMYLKPSGSELDRVEAYTTVVYEESKRFATGNRLTYFAADGSYTMVGTPASYCANSQETIGNKLNFSKSSNTITVDGNADNRTQMKAGAQCGERRKD